MDHATSSSRWYRDPGRLLKSLVHGALLTAGVFSVVVLAAGYLETGKFAVGRVQLALPGIHVPGKLAMAEDDADPADQAEPDDARPLSREMLRVGNYVARRYRVSKVALEPLLAQAEDTGRQLGLDPLLLVAMIAVESSFNPFAESTVGAQGLMQVIPRFHMDKIGQDAGDDALFDPQVNIRVGALVLKEGLSRFGSLQNALQYYGGALNDPQAGYASKVLSVKARLVQEAGRRRNAA